MFGRLRSFGDKIALAVTATSGIAVIAVAVPLAVVDHNNLRRETVALVRSQAAIVALDSGAALVFADPVHAEETLRSLRAVPDVAAAALFDREGNLFASYQRASGPAPPAEASAAGPTGERMDDSWLYLTTPVVDLGETQGRLRIVYDVEPLSRRLRASLALAFAVAIGAMLVAYLIARRVRRDLTAPITELAATASVISATRDYSRRATKLGEDELGQLTDAFNEMLSQIQEQEKELHAAHAARGTALESERTARAEAERASRMKDEFLATLSHELRTPLTPIVGWMDILERSDGGEDLMRKGVEVIGRNARVLSHIIDDLLDMSRIISGKVRLDVQPVTLSDVVEAAMATVRPSADARGLRLQAVIDPNAGTVRGDAARLQQVVWNLLSNAIRFTPKGGRVQVGLARVNSHTEIVVSDTGQGIAPDFLPHVFERFRQADSSITRQHGGLGLGLAIVRQLVELHGGSVRAESPGEGKGATFTVILPLMIVHAEDDPLLPREHPRVGRATPVPDAELPSLDSVHILVVDDEEDARELLARILEPQGARVSQAGSAAEALAALPAVRPDVLISDIGMPGVDGYELIRRVRALAPASGGATPAIAVTAFARAEDRTRSLLSGYQLHLAKPFAPSELIVAVASLHTRGWMGNGA